jgi:predicted small lipoprotein YifL
MMTTRTARTALSGLGVLALVFTLSACGERPQTQGGLSAAKRDSAPVTGTSTTVFKDGTWKTGDANGWQQQLKSRTQYGQSDYMRVSN